ncbi:hypothetical protein [Spirillospora albida]|uniref:hypothetical protein n=1 Tax=Spirillospora albida TaxID=58123 RepID=UPI0004C0008A|nr:hypothetical protein [Spirillospora albida]
MASTSALLLGLVLAGPALWHAFVVGDLEVTTALVRYLIAVAISAVMLGLLRRLGAAYARPPAPPDGPDGSNVTVTAQVVNPPYGRRTTDPQPGPAPGAAEPATAELPAAPSPS